MEIRSYRRVFELERRIYRIDRVRLNPAGVPIRAIVYFLGCLLAVLLADVTPAISLLTGALPWYVRDLLAPGAGAALLTMTRVDGRASHVSLHALLRHTCGTAGLRKSRRSGLPGSRWTAPSLVIVPDGSEGLLHRLRYRGPGSVQVASAHELVRPRRWLSGGAYDRRRLVLRGASSNRSSTGERRIVLERGASLDVRPASAAADRRAPVHT